jgi:endonuclease/exonuclease/phosphatase family metal-dependent hydrolase
MARNRFFGLTSRVLMVIVAGLLILSYASIVVNPAKIWLISLVGIFFIPLSILNLILLLWALKRRSRSFLIPLLALLPAFFFVGRYVQIDSEEDRIARMSHTGNTIKVVSYNVGRFALDQGEFSSRSDCADSVFAFILEQDPDIICLQEFHISDVDNIRAMLRKRMSDYKAEYYMFPTGNGAFGNVTLSRIPVTNKGVIKFDGSANLAIYTDYSLYGRDFRVYNCHFESYNISMSGLLRAMTRKDSGVFTETGNKMKRSITRRPKQVDQVFSDIEKCPVESFVCGDFNDNPMSYTYFRMTRGRKDAFIEAGNGFGATFATLWPVLRIDYILFPERFKAISHDIPRVPYSDHYPVVTEIEL